MLYSRIGDTAITRKSRGPKKARFLYGEGEARNRFLRCQYCGFIIDTKKIPPASSKSSINITESDIKEQILRCEDEILYYNIFTEDLQEINDESNDEIFYPYEPQNNITPVLVGPEGQYLFLEGQDKFGYYIQYGPLEEYRITSNCPFCGAQYTK